MYIDIYIFLIYSSSSSACLNDIPAEGEFDVNATILVGLEYNADEQCKAQFGSAAVSCPYDFATRVS